MKALASAERDKQALKNQSTAVANDAMLELESLDNPLNTAQEVTAKNQKAAANIFHAAQSNQSHFSKAILALAGLIGLCIVWFGYKLIDLNVSDAQVLMAEDKPYINNEPSPKPQVINSVIAHQLEAPQANPELSNAPEKKADLKPTPSSEPKVANEQTTTQVHTVSYPADRTIFGEKYAPAVNQGTTDEPIDDVPVVQESNKKTKVTQNQPSPTIQIISEARKSPRVDQTLMRAYTAFTQGNDLQAKQLYREVLKKDVQQIDALLGMASIAQRQSRRADAMGWYKKVLEIEPRNPVALSGIANAYPQADKVSQLSHLKNLIAKAPDTAHYHASLGNLYANESQWRLAQQAYFDAARLAQDNAEYAFNLAISLEHLGKPKLAVTHYQRALNLVMQSGASTPDHAQIKARLTALE